MFNKPGHGLERNGLVAALEGLFRNGHIEAGRETTSGAYWTRPKFEIRYGREASAAKPVMYIISYDEKAAAVWEAFASPDWEQFILNEDPYSSDENGDPRPGISHVYDILASWSSIWKISIWRGSASTRSRLKSRNADRGTQRIGRNCQVATGAELQLAAGDRRINGGQPRTVLDGIRRILRVSETAGIAGGDPRHRGPEFRGTYVTSDDPSETIKRQPGSSYHHVAN